MIKRTTRLNAQKQHEAMTAAVAAIMAMSYVPEFNGQKETETRLNASLITQSSFSEPLTTYATGWQDGGNIIQQELDFFAPSVEVGRRFEYLENINWEAFLSGTEEDLRAIGGDFKSVKYNSKKELGKTENRGLQILVDLDEVKDEPNWEQKRVAKLKRRLLVNKLRRAIALYTAADVNTGKAWDIPVALQRRAALIHRHVLHARISAQCAVEVIMQLLNEVGVSHSRTSPHAAHPGTPPHPPVPRIRPPAA